ncbi:ABC transporter permease [Paraglaciecola sp.]|uniref:ABC transporter permease n=1 Tax=Paraglaciecola sp. TaxID=1920173 RepID=UPI0030F3A2C3
MSNSILEFKLALASLQKAWGFVLAVILTLGITLGALVSILSLNHLLYVKPLPYDDYERLQLVKGVFINNGVTVMNNVNSYASAGALYGMKEYFEQAAMLTFETLELDTPQRPLVTSTFTTPEYFSLLNTPMAVGRYFSESEKVNSYNPVAVISYQTWQNIYQGREDILQQSAQLNERSFNIIGVTAKTFNEPHFFSAEFTGTEIWLPWDYHQGSEEARKKWTLLTPRTNVIGKISKNLSQEQAQQAVGKELNRIFTTAVAPPGRKIPYSMSAEMASFESVIIGESRTTALLLLLGSVTLLLIACSNVINLMLSRIAQKHRQLTIKATLGASPWHLFKSILAENIILMGTVFVFAIGCALVGFDLLRSLAAQQLPRLGELSFSFPVIIVTLIITTVLALLFSALSSRVIKYRKLQTSLQSSGKGTGLQVSPRVRSFLTASQVTLAVLLVVANLSVLKESSRVIYQSLGFETKDLNYLSVNYRGKNLSDTERAQMSQEVISMLENQAQISAVSATTSEPTTPSNGGTATQNFGDDASTNVMMFFTSEQYFDVIQQPLVEGRAFTAAEVREQAQVAVITETLAAKLYLTDSAIGKNIVHNNNKTPYKIVGIVKDLSLPPLANALGGADMSKNHLYMPGYTIARTSELRFLVKTMHGQTLSKLNFQEILNNIDPKLKVWVLESMEVRHSEMVSREVATAQITVALTIISLLLAGVGIYGVLNYGTQLRQYELGVRMSIGANPNHIIFRVLKDNLRPVLYGFVASAILGTLFYSVLRQHFEGYLHIEGVELVAAAGLILLTAAVASYLPLRPIVNFWPAKSLKN